MKKATLFQLMAPLGLSLLSVLGAPLNPPQAEAAASSVQARNILQQHLSQWKRSPFVGNWKSRVARANMPYLEIDYSVRFQNDNNASIQLEKPKQLAGFQEIRSPSESIYSFPTMGLAVSTPQAMGVFYTHEWFPGALSSDPKLLESNYQIDQLPDTTLAKQAVNVLLFTPRHQDCEDGNGGKTLCVPKRKVYFSKQTHQILGFEAFWDLGNKPFYQNFAVSHQLSPSVVSPHEQNMPTFSELFELGGSSPFEGSVLEVDKRQVSALLAYLPSKFTYQFRFDRLEQVDILGRRISIWYFTDGISICMLSVLPLDNQADAQASTTVFGALPGNETTLLAEFLQNFLYYLPYNFYHQKRDGQLILAQGELPPALLQQIAESWPSQNEE